MSTARFAPWHCTSPYLFCVCLTGLAVPGLLPAHCCVLLHTYHVASQAVLTCHCCTSLLQYVSSLRCTSPLLHGMAVEQTFSLLCCGAYVCLFCLSGRKEKNDNLTLVKWTGQVPYTPHVCGLHMYRRGGMHAQLHTGGEAVATHCLLPCLPFLLHFPM